MFRVYDLKMKRWVTDDIYLSPNPYSNLYVLKRSIFGTSKLVYADKERYIVHKEIELCDVNGLYLHEGDYIEATVANDRIVNGMVVYAEEFAAYILLCTDSEEYFILGNEVSENIKIIGNVFDGYKK